MSHSYQDLRVWQKAVDFVTEIYKTTAKFPKHELYGLRNQLERSAVSVPSNIAEGEGRASRRDFHHFLVTARGSLFEIETQLIIANNLGYISKADLKRLLADSRTINAMLCGLMESMADTATAN